MTNEIIYTNLAARPKQTKAAPTPEASPAPPVKRITWGIQGRLHLPDTAERSQQPKRETTDLTAPSDRPSRSSSREMRSYESRSMPPEKQRVRMGQVDRGSKLERLPEQRLLSERLDRQTAQPALEYLTILHSQSAEKYRIADAETGKIFLPQAFITLQHCREAAVEMERTFAMAQVLEMRSPETMESMGELVQEHWMRERVAVSLG